MAEVKINGLAELQKLLNTLPAKMEANVMRSALRAGANVILAQARANAPVKTGTLKRGLKVSTRSRRGVVSAKVRATGEHAYIAPWIEYGTAAHGVKKGANLSSGKYQDGKLNPGITPRPFMRPALDSKATQAVIAVGNAIKKRLATKNGIDTSDIEVSEE